MNDFVAPKRILLTGGAGFIGSNVVKILRERYPQATLRVLHLPRENLKNLDGMDDVERMAGDITKPEDCARAVAGCDTVFHLAAVYAFWLPDMSLMRRVNVEGTRNVLAACRDAGVRRVVYTSSAVNYCGQGLDVESDERSPFSLIDQEYAVSKHESHLVAEAFARAGLDIVIVCPVAPMGPGDIGPTPTGRMITEIFNLPFPVAVRSRLGIIDVRDCALGHVLALERGRTGESYILSGGNYYYSEMLERVLALCGTPRKVRALPTAALYPLAWAMKTAANLTGRPPLMTPAELNQARRGMVCSAAKARAELGLETRPLDESLRDALVWFVRNGYIVDRRVAGLRGVA